MTTGIFTIETDVAREYLHITMAGDWDHAVVKRFMVEVVGAVGKMIAGGARPHHLVTLCDMRAKNILPQNVAEEFRAFIRPGSPSKRIALLISGALHKMQGRRLIPDPRVRLFDDEDVALAWLMADEGVVSAAA